MSGSSFMDTVAMRERERQSYLPTTSWNTPDWQLALNGTSMPNYEALYRHTIPSTYVPEKSYYEPNLKEVENTPRSVLPPSNVYPAEQNPIGYEGRPTEPEFRAASGPMPSSGTEPVRYYDSSGRADIRMQSPLFGDPSKPVTPEYSGRIATDLNTLLKRMDDRAQWIAAVPGARGSFVNPPIGNAAMQRALAAEAGVPHYLQHGAVEAGYVMPFEPPGLPGVPKQSYVVPARATTPSAAPTSAPVPYVPKSRYIDELLARVGERVHTAADLQDIEEKLAPSVLGLASPLHKLAEFLHLGQHGSDKGKH